LRIDSWSNELVVRQSPAGRDLSMEAEDTVEICQQAATGEHTANCNYSGWSVSLSETVVVICSYICKCLVNPITNPNPIYSHSKIVTIFIK
jgi:hypothetical protein